MGGVKSNIGLPVTDRSRLRDWEEAGGIYEQRLLRHRITTQEAVMHRICLPHNTNFQQQAMKYEYRRQQHQSLVEVYYVGEADGFAGCSGKTELNVLVERISYRLCDIAGLSSVEGVYVLKNALMGFKTIQQMNGLIKVDSTLVGFNHSGKVRVWLNTNHALNSPESHRVLPNAISPKQARSNQIAMVDRVIRIVWMHVRQTQQQSFLSYYEQACLARSSRGFSFFQALNFVEEYIEEKKIQEIDQLSDPSNCIGSKRLEDCTLLVDYESSKIPREHRKQACTPADTSTTSEVGSNYAPAHYAALSERQTQIPSTPLMRHPQASNPIIRITSANRKKLTLSTDTSIKTYVQRERTQGLRLLSRQQPREAEPFVGVEDDAGRNTTRVQKVSCPTTETTEKCKLFPFSDRAMPFSNLMINASERNHQRVNEVASLSSYPARQPASSVVGSQVGVHHPSPGPLTNYETYRHRNTPL